MMCIVYVVVDDGIGVGMLYYVIRYVRPVIQIVTITLPIHYCISSITYANANYNVNISNESYRILEIPEINKNLFVLF